MQRTLRLGWYNVEIFLVMAADCGAFYPLLPSWWAESERPYLLFVLNSLVCTYYSGPFLHGGAEDIRRVIVLPISEFALLPAVQFLLYATEGAALDYYVGSLRFKHVVGGVLFRFPFLLVNVPTDFPFLQYCREDAYSSGTLRISSSLNH